MVTELIRPRPKDVTKRRGVFYTPFEVSDLLADWAIRSPSDHALEPSFGGCNFLASLHRRFEELGVAKPWEQIFGCDIASVAFNTHLPRLIPANSERRNFLKADFLQLTPESFGLTRFQSAVGNPPYVSYHNMYKTQRSVAFSAGFDDRFRVPQTGNLWSYFVFHTLRFLEMDGRMAWVLPSSLVLSDYGRLLLTELGRRFSRVAVVSLRQKLFVSTDEKTEILLCDGLGQRPGNEIQIAQANSITDCALLLHGWNESNRRFTSLNDRALLSVTPRRRLSAFQRIAQSENITSLGNIARISIGIVTGANEFFVISRTKASDNKLPNEALKPILAKLDIAPGLTVTKSDFAAAKRTDLRCLLVNASNRPLSAELKKYFTKIKQRQRKANVTFKKRKDWRIPDAGIVPDAFLPYMHHTGPRLILNGCKTNSTNTIHRVYFNSELSESDRQLVAISLLSSFSQFSAELEGRVYGSGVLKHELGEACSIKLMFPKSLSPNRVRRAFVRLDLLLRSGNKDLVTQFSDSFLSSFMPEMEEPLRQIKEDLRYIRNRRQKRKR